MRGETVYLIEKTVVGADAFNAPIYAETKIAVDDVLIGSPTFEQAVDSLNLYGKKIAFTLGIPKGDAHTWKDTKVIIRNEVYRTYGEPLIQTPANVPGRWNMQVKVEKYG